MEPFADMGCVLRVNPHCDACKGKMLQLLSSIIGVYSVSMDSPRGLVTVYGEADPNRLLNALASAGMHGELVRATIQHPQISRSRPIRPNIHHPQVSRARCSRADYYHPGIGNSRRINHYPPNYIDPRSPAYYSYGGGLEDPYDYSRAYNNNNRWWSGSGSGSDDYSSYWDRYYCPMTKEVPSYDYYYNYYSHSRDLPPARHVPGYAPQVSSPYEDEPINLCTIM